LTECMTHMYDDEIFHVARNLVHLLRYCTFTFYLQNYQWHR